MFIVSICFISRQIHVVSSQKPGSEVMSKKVPKKTVEEIVDTKKADLTAGTKEAGMRTIEGSIRSMGLKLDY